MIGAMNTQFADMFFLGHAVATWVQSAPVYVAVRDCIPPAFYRTILSVEELATFAHRQME